MLQAHGSDRLRQDGDRWILSARLEKGWTARVEKTSTSSEFPGTAVLAGEQYFEVVRVEAIPQGIRYVLAPWREDHAIRVADRYDAESEAARLAHRDAAIAHTQRRHAFNLLGVFVGHLPGDVQEKIGMEYGIYAHWLTLMSTAPLYLAALAIFMTAGDRLMNGEIPSGLLIAGIVLFAETLLRSMWAFFAHKPMGSLIGILGYSAYAAATGQLKSGMPKIQEAPEDVAMADAIAVREPLLTLLPNSDQVRIAHRFPYQYRHLSSRVAIVILLFAMIGAITAASQGHVPGALVAALIAFEQLYRLSEFRRGPAGSVLGYLVRPVVRKFL